MTEFDIFCNDVMSEFKDCADFFCREGNFADSRFAMLFLRGITSRDFMAEAFVRPLLRDKLTDFNGDFRVLLETPNLSPATDASSAAELVAKGEALILVENKNGFFKTLANAQFNHGRSITEPDSDVTIRGPKAGFVEDAEKNMAMLRKYVRTPKLKFRQYTLGTVSETGVMLAYVSGRADETLVEEIAKKLSSISADIITDSTHVSMLLSGKKTRILPDCGSSEKVDKVASKLMAGRIAIIVDGSPFVLTLPYLFIEGLQSAEDYLHTPFYATFIRVLRLFAMISAVFAPAILCAVVNYNPELIPKEFYGLIEESRKDIPLSFFWEILIILFLFEVLREVGVRMPRTVGDAVGILGSVIIGNTAVEAGIVSSVGVITVAFSAVCAFITPAFMYIILLSRMAVLVVAELFGGIGLAISAVLFVIILSMKKSFGAHYLYPILPFNKKGMQDTIFAWPKKTLGRRENIK